MVPCGLENRTGQGPRRADPGAALQCSGANRRPAPPQRNPEPAARRGSLVGLERERLLWAAGIRPHMLVSVGACLFMLVSAYGFADSLRGEHVVLDPSRAAAQVVSGIGFLGAGAILARGEIVRGLTTAP